MFQQQNSVKENCNEETSSEDWETIEETIEEPTRTTREVEQEHQPIEQHIEQKNFAKRDLEEKDHQQNYEWYQQTKSVEQLDLHPELQQEAMTSSLPDSQPSALLHTHSNTQIFESIQELSCTFKTHVTEIKQQLNELKINLQMLQDKEDKRIESMSSSISSQSSSDSDLSSFPTKNFFSRLCTCAWPSSFFWPCMNRKDLNLSKEVR